MHAVAVVPAAGPVPQLIELPEPAPEAGEVLVEGLLVGVCATDRAVAEGAGSLSEPLVVGHESLGRVTAAAEGTGFTSGDLVVGLIRRPCPEGCVPCGRGEIDRCLTRPPVERGISRADGFAAELWSSRPEFLCAVPSGLGELGVLIEPASSVLKGLRRAEERPGVGPPGRALVLGAGTIGTLAATALAGRGLDVDVVDPFAPPAAGATLRELGVRLLNGAPPHGAYDRVVEASGAPEALGTCLEAVAPLGHVLVLGLPTTASRLVVETDRLVTGDVAVTFSVNATTADYAAAAELLSEIDRTALGRLIGRELPMSRYADALSQEGGPGKTVLRVAA